RVVRRSFFHVSHGERVLLPLAGSRVGGGFVPSAGAKDVGPAIAAEVVQDVFGGSLEDLGATLGDVLGQAFDGMAEGLASGMAEAIGSLEQAFSYMAEAQSDAPDTVAGDWRNAPPGPTQGRSRDKRAEQSRAQPNPNR
ncbi:MAG: hypothetical protein ACE5FJ_04605, partial [Gemmatimonadales bacterium]